MKYKRVLQVRNTLLCLPQNNILGSLNSFIRDDEVVNASPETVEVVEDIISDETV